MGFLAALGVLRVVSRHHPDARLAWIRDGTWLATLHTRDDIDLIALLASELDRWRGGHPALDFAVGADRKVQDLKHQPDAFRELMRSLVADAEASEFVAAYATGVAIDGTGQTKPTSLHFTAGQQRFMDAVLDIRDSVTREDFEEALHGPWIGRAGPKDTRWRAASDRSRALLSFDPSKEKARTLPGAAWIAFQAMPLFPVVPVGLRAVTTGFTGRGKREQFTWPIWSDQLSLAEIRTLVGLQEIGQMTAAQRESLGVAAIFQSRVVRNPQGYGSFSVSEPV